jgi:hypothetical protein
MAQAPNAILAINSTDRFVTNKPGNVNQPISNVLIAEYQSLGPYANDFQITAPNALMNGYIDKIVISQIQIQYNLPTMVPDGNDLLLIVYETPLGAFVPRYIELPYGYYTPDALAAMLAVTLNTDIPVGEWTVQYFGATGLDQGYTVTNDTVRFFLPTPTAAALPPFSVSQPDILRLLKTYKLFGFTVFNSNFNYSHHSWSAPQFLYTPYIDIYSDALTNYQNLKDTDTSVSRRKGLLARVYLSGVGNPVISSGAYISNTGIVLTAGEALGSRPFLLTYDLNTPKIIKWTPDSAINTLDFQLRDCYGDLLFTVVPPLQAGNDIEQWNTEFQITLLCVEKDY